jgi:ribosomal protein S19E (S16A)
MKQIVQFFRERKQIQRVQWVVMIKTRSRREVKTKSPKN